MYESLVLTQLREHGCASRGFWDDGQVDLSGRQPGVLLVVMEVAARADEVVDHVFRLQHAIVEALVELFPHRVRLRSNNFGPGRTRQPCLGHRQLFRKRRAEYPNFALIKSRTLRDFLNGSINKPTWLERMFESTSEPGSSHFLLIQQKLIAQSVMLGTRKDRNIILINQLREPLLRHTFFELLILNVWRDDFRLFLL